MKDKSKLKQLEQKIQELEAGWKRTAADFDNFRKRAEEQKNQALVQEKAEFLTKITPVLDNFRRAFEHMPADQKETEWTQGVKQIEKQLEDILAAEGLSRIPTQGQKFDPNLHEAVSYEPNKLPEDTIIEELESGWQVNERVIKPAKVRVSRGT